MPELPEVETTRRGIAPHVEGKQVIAVRVRQPQLRWLVPDSVQLAVGYEIRAVRRRAKYLLLDTAAGSIVLHLGMSGSLTVQPTDKAVLKHDHLDIVLDDGYCLRLNDPRRFGACLWQGADEPELKLFAGLGPEPLTDAFDGARLFERSRGRTVAVKNFIMTNAVVVGVGNIYANEALFMSGIDPRRAAGKVSRQRYQALAQNIKTVLAKAIEQGGTTLRDFLGADGKPGYFRIQLKVYGKAGEACPVCGTAIRSLNIGQRNSFYCPKCQR
ncbi:MAG: bifunctional DNA-formamidopyrimidine glycosylase/DNA-(apurinic or apyrimidinic site) lyase [Opitutales bacterium]|jgi:formamidopyrimidine-DNA glycosylase|nr:bifunctional DNA-formamidopyrimidine glycosylase/DNA-(apurinic or apyrimidinic site) lyase [Opitutales bacterium]MDP4778159.1 bifunctional DNA-formamidopyrimidine glycosylase/DNA-(apurinic or apyrimidinic site) lyase [Opitutales bacterium]MDP4878445.1 bifunctional DNA-formamidopyrimidine glycosylase/DNA-(apurinic or apyrimidinic site) lyase [Opitutales bacterium]MDP4883959.1 bifunctional DNA-formamidopyrimidine glycosylase/DNA-(apurinic or apyrimidinic site) lyase [Opitutales bacterium]MDP50